ncbi:hypothetical protein RvY_13651-2 [Ramazzottius varieornatus]|uniref:Uncharacterized protein n=1 Tax=Ramazzottius varieornatus TaxID=947166 RepID=A0A1D1VTU4_RAMVA|nr:hypothetical protein RvY_13651-2 [Ramazzottius varieornatus]
MDKLNVSLLRSLMILLPVAAIFAKGETLKGNKFSPMLPLAKNQLVSSTVYRYQQVKIPFHLHSSFTMLRRRHGCNADRTLSRTPHGYVDASPPTQMYAQCTVLKMLNQAPVFSEGNILSGRSPIDGFIPHHVLRAVR